MKTTTRFCYSTTTTMVHDYMDTATVATASDSWATRKPKYASQMNWAAMEDDDDDDEEEDEDDDSW